jgi:osmotically-inducible protein OsmY
VRDALNQHTPRRVWQHSIQIRADAGAVTLTGAVRGQAEKEIAERLARGVKGVSDVQNQLVADSDLELAVAAALNADARTRGAFPGILVGAVFGGVYLKGPVASEETKNAAGEIARRVAGVQRVLNELTVSARVAA